MEQGTEAGVGWEVPRQNERVMGKTVIGDLRRKKAQERGKYKDNTKTDHQDSIRAVDMAGNNAASEVEKETGKGQQ